MTFPVPLDEYPIHQAPLSLRYVGTSDRNFYDRSYFNAHDRTGDVFLVTGLGVYPNLGSWTPTPPSGGAIGSGPCAAPTPWTTSA